MASKLIIKISSETHNYEYNFDDPEKLEILADLCKEIRENYKDPSRTLTTEELINLGASVELFSCLALLADHTRTCRMIELNGGTIEHV